MRKMFIRAGVISLAVLGQAIATESTDPQGLYLKEYFGDRVETHSVIVSWRGVGISASLNDKEPLKRRIFIDDLCRLENVTEAQGKALLAARKFCCFKMGMENNASEVAQAMADARLDKQYSWLMGQGIVTAQFKVDAGEFFREFITHNPQQGQKMYKKYHGKTDS